MSELTGADRDAVPLRYSGKDLRGVGSALGLSEDAARKRVGRLDQPACFPPAASRPRLHLSPCRRCRANRAESGDEPQQLRYWCWFEGRILPPLVL